ncbi:hypothetical protein ACH5RR_013649 [Cinchona calisaya]|uniref:WEB family protein n=1 Tax=Cinchona calisaya TaxID=153742 RepID=A0ABD3A3A8_9GENT
MNMESEGGVVVRGRVEIDMRQPFRSVKEAVTLFGEKVLAGEIYGNKLKEKQTKGNTEAHNQCEKETAVITADGLEETKQSLEKSKELEGNLMAYYLRSLKQELEQTKKELQQLKGSRELIVSDHHHKPPPSNIDDEIEELKFIENTTTNFEVKKSTQTDVQEEFEFENNKRSVKFASPPLLTRVIISKEDGETGAKISPLIGEKKFKKKPLNIPLFGLLFSKKKGYQKEESL